MFFREYHSNVELSYPDLNLSCLHAWPQWALTCTQVRKLLEGLTHRVCTNPTFASCRKDYNVRPSLMSVESMCAPVMSVNVHLWTIVVQRFIWTVEKTFISSIPQEDNAFL